MFFSAFVLWLFSVHRTVNTWHYSLEIVIFSRLHCAKCIILNAGFFLFLRSLSNWKFLLLVPRYLGYYYMGVTASALWFD